MKGKGALGILGVLAVIQLVPLERSNPPVTMEVPASDEVRTVLSQSCYDCHSNEVRWTWYAWVAPVSWLVVYDVHHAREHLNFSTWDAYDAEERAEKREEAWEEVEEGEMPLWIYVPLHPEAELTSQDRQQIRSWAESSEG